LGLSQSGLVPSPPSVPPPSGVSSIVIIALVCYWFSGAVYAGEPSVAWPVSVVVSVVDVSVVDVSVVAWGLASVFFFLLTFPKTS
jgi:hypothetical protein